METGETIARIFAVGVLIIPLGIPFIVIAVGEELRTWRL